MWLVVPGNFGQISYIAVINSINVDMPYYSEIPMFYEAPPDVFSKARSLRMNMTPAEKKVWNILKGKNVFGLRFRAQHPIGFYIADFYCHKISLIIEIDGNIHNEEDQIAYDIERTEILKKWGIDIIRFTNHQVNTEFETVHQLIINEVRSKMNSLEKDPKTNQHR